MYRRKKQRAPKKICVECKKPKEEGEVHMCRFYGKFECCCRESWSSGNAYIDMYQQCQRCNSKVLPSELKILEGRISHCKREHDKKRCGMCAHLGFDCSKLRRRTNK